MQDILEKFDEIIEPIFSKVLYNTIQIQSLTTSRDTLLPKLMSGQVRVNNIKQTTDA
jgi:type I restriction enzyme S subunit